MFTRSASTKSWSEASKVQRSRISLRPTTLRLTVGGTRSGTEYFVLLFSPIFIYLRSPMDALKYSTFLPFYPQSPHKSPHSFNLSGGTLWENLSHTGERRGSLTPIEASVLPGVRIYLSPPGSLDLSFSLLSRSECLRDPSQWKYPQVPVKQEGHDRRGCIWHNSRITVNPDFTHFWVGEGSATTPPVNERFALKSETENCSGCAHCAWKVIGVLWPSLETMSLRSHTCAGSLSLCRCQTMRRTKGGNPSGSGQERRLRSLPNSSTTDSWMHATRSLDATVCNTERQWGRASRKRRRLPREASSLSMSPHSWLR